jgi:TonB family protein
MWSHSQPPCKDIPGTSEFEAAQQEKQRAAELQKKYRDEAQRQGQEHTGIFSIGGDVSAPIITSKVAPQYAEEARRAKYTGTALVSLVVDADGNPRDVHIARSLGLGLDEMAVEAVQKWKFKPGIKSGKPVNVRIQVEVNFRLL